MGKELTLGVLFKGKISPSLKKEIKALETIVNGLNKTLNKTVAATSQVTNAQKKQATASKKVTAATKDTSKALTFMGKQIGSIDGAYNRLMGAFKVTVSYGIAATAIYSVINAMKAGGQAIIDYDQGLKNLSAITGASSAEMTALGEVIKDVADATRFTTGEVADGMVLLGQAGFDAGESMSAIEANVNLATGTLSDMKTTTDLLTTTIRAFNMDATESGRVADVMASAINKSKLTIDKLRTSFNYVAATASQAGLSLEQTAATMMNLANNGLRASTIGTGLRQVLSRIVKPNEKLSQALASVGLNLKEINPRMSGWEGTLKSLSTVLYDSETKTVNMSKAFNLFGLRGAQAAAVIVKSYVGGDFTAAIENAYRIGTASEMAGKQAEGLGVKIQKLVARAELLAVTLGEAGVSGVLKTVIDGLRAAIGVVVDFAASLGGKVVLQTTAYATALWGVHKAYSALVVVLKKTAIWESVAQGAALATTRLGSLANGIKAFGMHMTMLIGKLNPFVIVAGAVATALKVWYDAQERQLRIAEKAYIKQDQITNSLETYQNALSTTVEKIKHAQETGAKYDAEQAQYLALLQRLIKAHPELANEIELSTKAFDANASAIGKTLDAEYETRLQKMITLSREYGESAQHAQMWYGVLEAIIGWAGKVGDAFLFLIDIGGKAYEFLIEQLAKIVEKIPFVGTAIADMLNRVASVMGDSKQNIIDYYTEYGKGSEKAKQYIEEQKNLWDDFAKKFAAVGEKQRMTIAEVEEELRSQKGVTDDMVNHIISKVSELRAKEQEYVGSVKESLNQMNTTWREYYDQKDIQGKYDLQQQWERLQKQASDYAAFLEKLGLLDDDRASKMTAWWAKQLQEYQVNEDKKTEKTRQALEKRETVYQRYADKVKAIEEKLNEDISRFRQESMKDSEIIDENLIAAREAVSNALRAIEEADTQYGYNQALKQLDSAREKYKRILNMAREFAENRKTLIKVADDYEEASITSTYDKWKKFYQDSGAALTIYKVKYAKAEEEKRDEAKKTTDFTKEQLEKVEKEYDRVAEIIKTKLDEVNTKFAEEKKVNLNTTEANTKIDETKEKADNLKIAAEETIIPIIDNTKANAALTDLVTQLTNITKTKWTSTHTIITKGLQALKDAINYQKNVAGKQKPHQPIPLR